MKIQWEYDFVERPFCEQLRTMGWDWIEGDVLEDARRSHARLAGKEE